MQQIPESPVKREHDQIVILLIREFPPDGSYHEVITGPVLSAIKNRVNPGVITIGLHANIERGHDPCAPMSLIEVPIMCKQGHDSQRSFSVVLVKIPKDEAQHQVISDR